MSPCTISITSYIPIYIHTSVYSSFICVFMLTSCVRNRLNSFYWMNICWRLSYVLYVSVDYSKLLWRFVFIDTLSGRQEPWPMFPLLTSPVCLCLCSLVLWWDAATCRSLWGPSRPSGSSPGSGGRSQHSRWRNLPPCPIYIHHMSPCTISMTSYIQIYIHTYICLFVFHMRIHVN